TRAKAGTVERSKMDDIAGANGLACPCGLSIDKGAVTARLIGDKTGSPLENEVGMATRDEGVGEDQIVLRQPANGEGRMRNRNGAAAGAIDEGERDRARVRS